MTSDMTSDIKNIRKIAQGQSACLEPYDQRFEPRPRLYIHAEQECQSQMDGGPN